MIEAVYYLEYNENSPFSICRPAPAHLALSHQQIKNNVTTVNGKIARNGNEHKRNGSKVP
jgi:hypothetical protein